MPGAVIVRSDVERKALFGVAETEKLPAEAYTDDVTDRVYATLADKARRDPRRRAFGHRRRGIRAAAGARRHRRSGQGEQHAAAGTVPHRGSRRPGSARVGARARDASDADATVARAQERYQLGRLDWTPIDASGTPEATLVRARAALRASAGSVQPP